MSIRFHGIMLVRDEADIIGQTLEDILSWADTVHILDTGSTDGTWEIIESFIERNDRIHAWRKEDLVFTQALRAQVFAHVRQMFNDGDWVVKLDADEFYHIPPPRFVNEFLRPWEGCVYLQWYFFRLTSVEAERYEREGIDLDADRQRSIQERRRFYKIPDHAEPRMFRYRDSMKWRKTDGFPLYAGYVARERIPIRHYPHRDPVQLKDRFLLRAEMKRRGSSAAGHWELSDWQKEVIDFDPDTGIGNERTVEGEGLSDNPSQITGGLCYWAEGCELPVVRNPCHLGAPWRRAVKSLFYLIFVRLADRIARGFKRDVDNVPLLGVIEGEKRK